MDAIKNANRTWLKDMSPTALDFLATCLFSEDVLELGADGEVRPVWDRANDASAGRAARVMTRLSSTPLDRAAAMASRGGPLQRGQG